MNWADVVLLLLVGAILGGTLESLVWRYGGKWETEQTRRTLKELHRLGTKPTHKRGRRDL